MPRIDVFSELGPRQLNAVGLAIYRAWAEFALGQRALGGRRLKQPTGAYASALRFEVISKNHVAVINESGHAEVIERGHPSFSMLDYMSPGQRVPITRTTFQPMIGGTTRYAINPETGRRARTGSGLMRSGRFVPSMTGIVRLPKDLSKLQGRTNTSGRGPAWQVPAMPAYSPARIIAALFSRKVSDIGGTINSTR